MRAVSRRMYFERREGRFPEQLELLGVSYDKVEDLRYGTNPHQAAAFYRPRRRPVVLRGYRLLKSGKRGHSQTNLEDMDRALRIVKYCEGPACAVMKHLNPSGAAEGVQDGPLRDVYRRARDCDAQAAFCSVVGFNRAVDAETAEEIMSTVVECVVAPGFEEKALAILSSGAERKRNRELRVVAVDGLHLLPRYLGDDTHGAFDLRTLDDGALVVAEPMLTRVRTGDDLSPAAAVHRTKGRIEIERPPTERELADLVFAWHVALNVRSNAMVIVKNRATLAVGTGEQDRIGALEQAIDKHRRKYRGPDSLQGAVLASDGYIPFRDCVEAAAGAGITTIVQPGGSRNDWDIIAACNDLAISMVFTGERAFSHH
ncbi:MAG: IMP cyclohydrolase [Armatimonadota bacterium]|nr:MAG: IMP cyclohydrolase [Armatimonadota bacterium]